jgi:hypothetical protein
MHELEIKRGLLSSFFQAIFLLFNVLMIIIFVFGWLANHAEKGLAEVFGLVIFVQTVWMPGAVIFGMLALVTREGRITVRREL